ncbi:TetR/AcrR family transcriptional regulator [Acerihabitans arboris]|uniref:TetR family transcriptional regulator n=1 Tax=Acerihabitans arboris TaxID=2691583 RepID=A0A845SCR1_9GAMM|nr:TetR/AcrR family transcriptional regulator [Acerihabitans arboris]NDL62673.1 TetR family transcriptional regulator [Acerihabitans arboris]
MKTSKSPAGKPRGRPRSFDRDAVLDRAMRLFWLRGYESTSMAELLKVMQVTTPSVYSAFGDKEHLFLEAIRRYVDGPARYQAEAFKEKTARAAVERMLDQAVESIADAGTPPGCMLALSIINCSAASEPVQKIVTEARREAEQALRRRIEQGIAEGDVPARTDAAALAGFFATVLYGLSIKAKEGVSAREARAVADTAMRVWPA